jgi:hypothetical protein
VRGRLVREHFPSGLPDEAQERSGVALREPVRVRALVLGDGNLHDPVRPYAGRRDLDRDRALEQIQKRRPILTLELSTQLSLTYPFVLLSGSSFGLYKCRPSKPIPLITFFKSLIQLGGGRFLRRLGSLFSVKCAVNRRYDAEISWYNHRR